MSEAFYNRIAWAWHRELAGSMLIYEEFGVLTRPYDWLFGQYFLRPWGG